MLRLKRVILAPKKFKKALKGSIWYRWVLYKGFGDDYETVWPSGTLQGLGLHFKPVKNLFLNKLKVNF